MKDQTKAPLMEALERMRHDRLVPFDVPGHKHGKGNPELTAFLGEQCLSVDVNSMKPLDNLCLFYGRRYHFCCAGNDFGQR